MECSSRLPERLLSEAPVTSVICTTMRPSRTGSPQQFPPENKHTVLHTILWKSLRNCHEFPMICGSGAATICCTISFMSSTVICGTFASTTFFRKRVRMELLFASVHPHAVDAERGVCLGREPECCSTHAPRHVVLEEAERSPAPAQQGQRHGSVENLDRQQEVHCGATVSHTPHLRPRLCASLGPRTAGLFVQAKELLLERRMRPERGRVVHLVILLPRPGLRGSEWG